MNQELSSPQEFPVYGIKHDDKGGTVRVKTGLLCQRPAEEG